MLTFQLLQIQTIGVQRTTRSTGTTHEICVLPLCPRTHLSKFVEHQKYSQNSDFSIFFQTFSSKLRENSFTTRKIYILWLNSLEKQDLEYLIYFLNLQRNKSLRVLLLVLELRDQNKKDTAYGDTHPVTIHHNCNILRTYTKDNKIHIDFSYHLQIVQSINKAISNIQQDIRHKTKTQISFDIIWIR